MHKGQRSTSDSEVKIGGRFIEMKIGTRFISESGKGGVV